jgi:hypothetical protein
MPAFARYVGIDYSGAQVPTASLPGLRVFVADHARPPFELMPSPSPRKYWTRRGIAEWLVELLSDQVATLVGIDHAFSFPLAYFSAHGLKLDWPAFLDDFQHHWPTDDEHTYVDFVREGEVGHGAARGGNSRWRRLTDIRAGAKSPFHFDVPGSVAKSTHAGLPWLRFIRQRLGHRVHFWPFDGWAIPTGRSAVLEAYPVLWSRTFARGDRNQHQHDAYAVAAWLRAADLEGYLPRFLAPALSPAEQSTAYIEGWILGIAGAEQIASESSPLGAGRAKRT